MDDIERISHVSSIQPVRKIRARLYDRERRELRYPHERNPRRQVTQRETEHLTPEASTPEELEQDLQDYKSDLKERLTFDRAQVLHEEPSSD